MPRRCEFSDCRKQPNFGPEGGKPIRCADHKDDGYVDVKNRRCGVLGCRKRCNFGPPGGNPTRCSDHKDDGYVDVFRRKCDFTGCRKHSYFGLPGGKHHRCSRHKEIGYVDVVSRICIFTGCTKRACFGPLGSKATRCSKHQDDHHVNVRNSICAFSDCRKRPSFGPPGGYPTRCSGHKDVSHVDVKNPRCKSLGCNIYNYYERPLASRVDPESNTFSLCCSCWRKMYPHLDNRIKVRKEHFVLAEIQRQVPELDPYLLIHDCKIPGQSCVTSRPDMCWIVNDTMIHVEIDEDGNQHEDDDDRLVAIHSATEATNHICIRFNPDKTQNHPPCLKKIRTCGGEHILRKNDFEWERRICVLIRNIREVFEKCLDNQGCDIAGKRKLFFKYFYLLMAIR